MAEVAAALAESHWDAALEDAARRLKPKRLSISVSMLFAPPTVTVAVAVSVTVASTVWESEE